MRIAAIPRAFARATEKYRAPFSTRQFAHFAAYLMGLTVGREGRNVQDIAALFVRACDQATLNHFVTDAPWSLARLWARHREIVAEAIRRVGARRAFLSLNDTVLWKRWGPKMERAGRRYSTTRKALVWGRDAVAAMESSGTYGAPFRRAANLAARPSAQRPSSPSQNPAKAKTPSSTPSPTRTSG